MECYITAGVTHDGFGARVQRCASVMCLVYYLQEKYELPIEYLHTPLNYESRDVFDVDYQHAAKERITSGYPYDDISHEGYMIRAKKWEDRLLFNSKTIKDIEVKDFTVVEEYQQMIEDIEKGNTDKKLYSIKYPHLYYHTESLDLNNFSKYRDKILNCFNFERPSPGLSQIALHIRRQDIDETHRRYIKDDYYLEILNGLKQSSKVSSAVAIYTQRDNFDASKYRRGYDIRYDDREEDYDTFIKLLSADVLVVGNSSFSYVAALLNPNTVVYHYAPDTYKALDSWIDKEKYLDYLNSK
jgi:hypothetical protein